MNRSLQGRRALVTGGASGIGAAIARLIAAEGAHVVIADVDAGAGRVVADEVGGDFVRLDVSDAEAWDRVVSDHDDIDLGFLNAGVTTGTGNALIGEGLPLAGLTDADYRRIMGVNVDGVVFGIRALAPLMAARDGGDIVVTASIAGLVPIPPDPIYGLTKHAVVGVVRSVAPGLAERGVHISSINPGFADTAILNDETKALIKSVGMPLLSPEECARAARMAVDARVGGAQWVVWPGREPSIYPWAPPVE
jgi:NAD(P)-dependent dehydrogenase (short-subunit alcohol dehydrogenase family)